MDARRKARERSPAPSVKPAGEPAGTAVTRWRRPADRRSRPQRWHDAVAELIALQNEYAQWFEALPEPLRDTPTGEALQAIVDLDLAELADLDTPRGFGRD